MKKSNKTLIIAIIISLIVIVIAIIGINIYNLNRRKQTS